MHLLSSLILQPLLKSRYPNSISSIPQPTKDGLNLNFSNRFFFIEKLTEKKDFHMSLLLNELDIFLSLNLTFLSESGSIFIVFFDSLLFSRILFIFWISYLFFEANPAAYPKTQSLSSRVFCFPGKSFQPHKKYGLILPDSS